MPNTEFHEYEDSPEARIELLDFLVQSGDLAAAQGGWKARLAHWWDENPFAHLHPYRGRVVRASGRIVGFGGAIPACYTIHEQQVPVLLASTLRVDERHPESVLPMLLKMRAESKETIIILTTPIPKLQHALDKMEAVSEKRVYRRFFPIGKFAQLLGSQKSWPTLDSAMTLITDVTKVNAIQRPWSNPGRLEKWTTLASLRWYLSTPTRQQHLLGAIDREGTLHSYLILHARRMRGLLSWDIVESFTTRDSAEELQALAGALVRKPTLLPKSGPLLTVASFSSDQTWDSMPSLITREQQVCHYFMLPPALRSVPKLTMMAEGDLVL